MTTKEMLLDTFNYTEVAIGGANHRGRVKRLEDVEPHGADHYTSVYDHGPDFEDYVKERGTCKGYKGAVRPRGAHFDIDRPELADAIRDTRRLGSRLVNDYGMPPEMIRFYFSGSKGFHVEVPSECFGGIEASVNAPEKVKNLALRILDGMKTDTAVYDHNRLWRSPNTINSKTGLYKVPLSYDEVMNLAVEDIEGLARGRRSVAHGAPDPVPPLVALKDATNVTLRDETPKITDGQTDNLAAVIQEFMPSVGDRHVYGRALAGYLLPRLKKPQTLAVMLDAWDGADGETLERLEALVNDTAEKWLNDEPFEGGPTLNERAPGILSTLGAALNARDAKPRTGDPLAEIVSARDLMQRRFVDPEYVVDGIVPEGVGLLAGKPKIGKSWLALGECIAVASGGKAYGDVGVKRGRALYLALEDNQRRVQSRLKAMLQGDPIPDRLDFVTEWPRIGEGCEDALSRYLECNPDTKLVYVDTLKKIRPRVKASKGIYDADYEALEPLLKIAAEHNVSIQVVHHLNKMIDPDDPLDSISGSTGLTGGVDAVRVLNRTRGAADALMFVTGRDVEEQSYAMRFDGITTSWLIVGEAAEVQMSKARKVVYDALRDEGKPLNPAAIAQKIGKGASSVRELLRHMLDDGQVSANDNNQYYVPLSTTTTEGVIERELADGPDNPDAPDSPDAPDARDGVRASESAGGKTDATDRSDAAKRAESRNSVSSVRGVSPELWEFVRSLPPDALPAQADVDELRERYGTYYAIRTPQELMSTYLRDGYAKPKFRIRDGQRVLVGLVAA